MDLNTLIIDYYREEEARTKEGYIFVGTKNNVNMCSVQADSKDDALKIFYEKFGANGCVYNDGEKLILKKGTYLNEFVNIVATPDDIFANYGFYSIYVDVNAFVKEEKVFFTIDKPSMS